MDTLSETSNLAGNLIILYSKKNTHLSCFMHSDCLNERNHVFFIQFSTRTIVYRPSTCCQSALARLELKKLFVKATDVSISVRAFGRSEKKIYPSEYLTIFFCPQSKSQFVFFKKPLVSHNARFNTKYHGCKVQF